MGFPRNEQTDELFAAILSLGDIDECYRFFEDICTAKELKEISSRLCVARLLDRGESYMDAVSQTGVSSATVGRVKRCLEYGTGGYRSVIERLNEKDK